MAAWVRVCVYLLAVLLTAYAGPGEVEFQSRAIHDLLRWGIFLSCDHMHEAFVAYYKSAVVMCDCV